MNSYRFQDGFPYYEVSASEGYQIRDCNIHHIKDGQIFNTWDFNSTAPSDFPTEWFKSFWKDLKAAPCFVIREDQWSSDYYSLLNGYVVRWRDDRKEGSDFVEHSVTTEEFLKLPWGSESALAWLKKTLAAS